MSTTSLDRRGFLRISSAFAGSLVLAVHFADGAEAAETAAEPAADFAPNAFVRIAPDGRTTVMINKAEMGQGVCTSLAMIVAEELDADWSKVGFEFAPADLVYAHPGFGIQMTGGSTSVAGMTAPLRQAGAAARAMLVAAAAQRFGVPASELKVERGVVSHANGKKATFGELVGDAAQIEVPKDAPLKDQKQFSIVGKPVHRLDTPDKVHGRAVFGIDVSLPGMLTALVAHSPVVGGKVKRVRDAKARAIAGVKDVVRIPSGVAVLATGFWAAKRARDLLEIDWDEGENANLSTTTLREEYRRLSRTPGMVARNDGDAEAALKSAATTLEVDYELPYLAHATMEPMNCVVDLRADSCEVWAGTQFQTVDHAAAARVAGLPPDRVKLHTTFLGGGFGRRANPTSDYIVEAVEIAKLAKAPVKLVWTREDDMRGGYYRPMFHSRIRAGLDASGAITAWHHVLVGQSFIAGSAFEPFMVKNGIDGTSVEGADDLHYAIPNVRVELHTTKVPVTTLWWRSVGHSHTAVAVEGFLDQLAAHSGADPYEFRRKMLAKHPRHLGVLDRAAKESGWGKPLPKGHARGIAVHFSFASYVAAVVEASIENGRPKVHRVTCAIDCGQVVNPDTIHAQLEGAVGFGLTAALYDEITLEKGRVQQSNFHDYPMLRIHEMPKVDAHIVASDEPSSGVGEPGVPPIAPALCNALFALTKRPIHRLPIRPGDLSV